MTNIDTLPPDPNIKLTESDQRLIDVRTAITYLHDHGHKPTAKHVHEYLLSQNFSYTYYSINRSFNIVKSENTFVTDLTISTLSAEIEDVIRSFDYVIKEARLALDKNLDTIKKVEKTLPDGTTIKETSVVPNDQRVRLSYLKIIVDTSKLREQLILGRTLDISAASVHTMVKDIKAENMNLKARLVKHESVEDSSIGTKQKFILPRDD